MTSSDAPEKGKSRENLGASDRPPPFESNAPSHMGPPRTLLVVPQPFYSDRGSPIAVRQVVRAYLELGIAVDVATFPMGRDIDAPGLRFFRAANPYGIRAVPIGFSLRKVLLDLTLSWLVRKRLKCEGYHLVHAVEEAAFPALVLARRYGVPMLYDMHSRLSDELTRVPWLRPRPLSATAVRLESWLFRNATVIVTSMGLASNVRSVHPAARVFEWRFAGVVERPPADQAPQGNNGLRSELSIPSDAPVVLYSGTFSGYQGIDLLLGAAAFVTRAKPSAVFVLVGSEPQEIEEVQARAATLGITSHLRLVPRRPHAAMREYFGMADLLVSPRTSGRNLPLKIFDYLSADRPIVATDIPSHRTVLDEKLALLAPPTPEEVGQAVLEVLTNPEVAAELRRGAREYARTRMGWQAFVESLREIHQAAVTSGSTPRARHPPGPGDSPGPTSR